MIDLRDWLSSEPQISSQFWTQLFRMRLTLSTLPKLAHPKELTPLKNFYNRNSLWSTYQWKRTHFAIRPKKWTYSSSDLHSNTTSLSNKALGYLQCKNTITLPYLIRRSNYNNSQYTLHRYPYPCSYCINFKNLFHRLLSHYFNFLTNSFTIVHSIYIQLTNLCFLKFNRLNVIKNAKPTSKPILMLATALIL